LGLGAVAVADTGAVDAAAAEAAEARRSFSAALSSWSVGSLRGRLEGHGPCWYVTLPLDTHLFSGAPSAAADDRARSTRETRCEILRMLCGLTFELSGPRRVGAWAARRTIT
jgi:hypothetical protein